MGRDHSLQENPRYIPLCQLVLSQPGYMIFFELMRLNKQLKEKLPASLWKLLFKCNKGLSAWFLVNPSNQTLLDEIITAHPELIDSLISDYLAQEMPENATPLFWFSRTKEGAQVLDKVINHLIEHKSTLYQQLINDLFLTQPYKGNAALYVDTFPLFLLCLNMPGIVVLGKMVEQEPSLIKAIPSEYWLKRIPEFDNTFCLYQLLSSGMVGASILQKLINEHPDVIQQMTTEHLFYDFPRPYKRETSFLNLLITVPPCRAILTTLLEKNLELFQSISSHQWRNLLLSELDLGSFLNAVCQFDGGQDILYTLLSKLPVLQDAVADIIQNETLPLEADTKKSSTYSLLSGTETGQRILALLPLSRDAVSNIGFFSGSRANATDLSENIEVAHFKK